MTPDEFSRLGGRCFGFGWQRTLARLAGMERVAINRYAAGERPVPHGVALILTWSAERLNNGIPVSYIEPAGEIEHGRFLPK